MVGPVGFTAESQRTRRYAEVALSVDEVNERTGTIVDAAMKVHSFLGPGLLESAYEACLAHELRLRGLSVLVQKRVPLIYEGLKVHIGYRADLIVENAI